MSDDAPRARQPIPCPECGEVMKAGWVGVHTGLDGGRGTLRYTDQVLLVKPERMPGGP